MTLAFAVLLTLSHAAEKPALPVKSADNDDPLSLENLLDPGMPLPEILPNPDSFPEPASPSGSGTKLTASSAKAALISAANDYRRKTELFRKGKVSRDALRSSAIHVAQTAKTYRTALRR